jgi:hypothetical protein
MAKALTENVRKAVVLYAFLEGDRRRDPCSVALGTRLILRLGAMLCLFSSPFHSLHAQLGSSGGVSGIARASDGSEVSGAKITVSGPGGFSRTTVSAPMVLSRL